jgi:hypothetical protein
MIAVGKIFLIRCGAKPAAVCSIPLGRPWAEGKAGYHKSSTISLQLFTVGKAPSYGWTVGKFRHQAQPWPME